MIDSRMTEITAKLEQILERDMPNELKAHRIFMDIIKPISEELQGEYESLFFADMPSNPNGH